MLVVLKAAQTSFMHCSFSVMADALGRAILTLGA